MSDVFVSYARPDESQAILVAEALRGGGYRVWRDDELPAHRAYADVIQEKLKSAKAVVALWSANAAQSQWVRAEADTARAAGTLVQASLDGTIPPLPFNQIQCADLTGWDGKSDASGWRKLAASVSALAGSPTTANPEEGRRSSLPVSVCVLPFQNMSGDAEQEYFSDGISEDITTDLSKVSALEVIARNTAFTFKGQSLDVSEIARKLGISHVLEGSVRKAGNRVRITAQLIDGHSGGHVWADRYDRDLTDIFAIQDEISKAIVGALRLKLLPEEKIAIEQRGTTSADAYNLFLMARQYWLMGNQGDPRREERVIRLCTRASEIDPDYARAWALMALAQANLHFAFNRCEENGLSAADRALSLDPKIAEAHAVRARVSSEAGDKIEANRQIERALQLDPESWEVRKEVARLCMAQERMTEATEHFEKAVSLCENDFHSWAMLSTCYRFVRDDQRLRHAAGMMVSQAEKAIEEDPSNGYALGIGAGGLAILGKADRAKEWFERALIIDPDNLNMRYNFSCVLANYTNDREAALKLLRTTLPKAGRVMINIATVDPDMDPLRGDPRFQEMLVVAQRRLGIEPTTATPAAT